MNIRAICFDMDGVIIDSEPAHEKAFHAALKNYGVTMKPDDYKTYFSGKPGPQAMKDFFAAYTIQLSVQDVMSFKSDWYMKHAIHTTTLYRETAEFIKANSLGLPYALVTSSPSDVVSETLRLYELEDSFDRIVTLDDITEGKPNPEGYVSAASLLDIPAESCAAVEDSPSGVAAAKAAGMYCIALITTHSAEDLTQADVIVERLDETLFLKQ